MSSFLHGKTRAIKQLTVQKIQRLIFLLGHKHLRREEKRREKSFHEHKQHIMQDHKQHSDTEQILNKT